MLREAMDGLDLAHAREYGPMLTVCAAPGCTTVTMGGGTCVEHDVHVPVEFPRGRPFVHGRDEVLAGAAAD
jgi:hypothetical protein